MTKALLVAGDYHCALRTARQSTLLDPTSSDAHMALGRALYANKDVAAAVDEFRQAVQLDPLNAQARNDLGFALYARGQFRPCGGVA
ncbi:MAG: tetratricopeptide repeat protein, partial [Candidatus Competibacteraceae bacterium]|nr:tetratricopeptide repeat protein [Candidatus Competibacteraceae bacterium]